MDKLIRNCGLIALRNIDELKSISIRTLINVAEDNGIKLYPYKIPVDELKYVKLPAIFHAENHFVYVDSVDLLNDINLTGNVLLTEQIYGKENIIDDLKNITGETWVAAGVATVGLGLSAYQIHKGNQQKKEADKLAAENKRPDYEIPVELQQNLTQAQQMALEGLPAEQKQQYLNNIQRSQNFGLGALSDRRLGLAGLGSIVQSGNDASQNLLSMDAQARRQNQIGLMNARQTFANYKDKRYEQNQLNPYYENAAAIRGLKGAGMQNEWQGLSSGANTISSFGTSMNGQNFTKKKPNPYQSQDNGLGSGYYSNQPYEQKPLWQTANNFDQFSE